MDRRKWLSKEKDDLSFVNWEADKRGEYLAANLTIGNYGETVELNFLNYKPKGKSTIDMNKLNRFIDELCYFRQEAEKL